MLFLLFIFRVVVQVLINAVVVVIQIGIALGLRVGHFVLEEMPCHSAAHAQNQKHQQKSYRIGFLFRLLDRLRGCCGGGFRGFRLLAPTHSVMFLAQMGQVVFT